MPATCSAANNPAILPVSVLTLYLRLVGEAVANYRGEKEEREVETKIDLPVNAHIPHTYIDSERLRLQAYRQIAARRYRREDCGGTRGTGRPLRANCRRR